MSKRATSKYFAAVEKIEADQVEHWKRLDKLGKPSRQVRGGRMTLHPRETLPNRRRGAFFYLATPYSKYEGGIDAAFEMACRTTAALLKAGLPVFSPIAHSHPIAVHGEIDPYDHAIWLPADKPMMESALALIVYCENGWLDSFGIWEEIKEFKKAAKPVLYLSPRQLSDAIRFPFFVTRALELADEVRT